MTDSRGQLRVAAKVLGVLALAGCCLAGCGAGHDVTARNRPPKTAAFRVTSTLDGMHVLPHRIPWVASPSLPATQVSQVEFLVGRKVAWIEHKAPYSFSDDGGYLVTSWIRPGGHSFTVRATSIDGRVATDTVTAQVAKSPPPPAALAGTWHRRVDASGSPAAGSPGNPTDTYTRSGTYTMVIDTAEIQMRFPGRFVKPASDSTGAGWILDSDYTVGRASLRVQGAISSEPFNETTAEGGWWCYPGGPPAGYRWSVSGRTLTLRPLGKHDACGVRGFIWTGRWQRG